MKKAKTLLIAGVVVVVVLLTAAWFLLDANRYRGQVQARLQQQLQREVTLGDMRLGLMPLRFTVQNLTIADDPRFKNPTPFTQAEKLDVFVNFSALFGGNVVIDSVELVSPKVELIRDEAGVWNFSSLGGSKPAPPAAAPAAESSSSGSSGFALKKLAITGGSIAVTDKLRAKPRAVYSPIDVSLLDYAPGSPFSFEVAAHIVGAGSGTDQAIRVKGTGGPLPDSGPAAMPLQATVSLAGIDVAGLRQFLDSATLPTATGVLSGETQLENKGGRLSAIGKLALDKAHIGAVDIGYPIALDYSLASEPVKGIVEITSATLKLGPTPLTLTGSVDTNPNPMTANLRLKSGETTIGEVARLASAFGVAFSPDTTVTGRISGDVHASGPIDKLAIEGVVAGRSLEISGKGIPQPVQVGVLDLTLTPSEIRSNEFEAKSGKSVVNGRFALKEYNSKAPAMDVALRAPGASLPEIQAIAKAYGITGLDQLNGAGNLNFDLRASGPLDSVASGNVVKTLNGSLNLDFNTLRILGFDTARELATIGGFLKSAEPDKGYTDVLKLAGHIVVKNGIAESNDLLAQIPGASVAASGSSDLAAQTVQMKATAVFSKEFSDKVGGSKIGGFLSTALANERGEIVIPAVITGSMTKPKFAPDGQAFLQMQKNRLLPGLNNPRQALTNALEALSGKKKPEETDPSKPAEEQKNPLKGILNGLLGGKKK